MMMRTPYFRFRKETLLHNLSDLRDKLSAIITTDIYYSVKTNPDPKILRLLKDAGCCFMVCSYEELVSTLKVAPAKKMLYLNPSADLPELRKVKAKGVSLFVADSISQLQSMDKLGCIRVLIRVNTEVITKNVFRKSISFGMKLDELEKLDLDDYKDIDIIGVHNHLITQNEELASWKENMRKMVDAKRILSSRGFSVRYVDIGGGFPIDYQKKTLPLKTIISAVRPYLKKLGCTLIVEPGRYIVGKGSELVTSVKAIKKLGKRNIAFVDASVYNTIPDILFVGLKVRSCSAGTGKTLYEIRGCTPDSLDVFAHQRMGKLSPKDQIIFQNAGAYNFSSDFLSLRKPRSVIE